MESRMRASRKERQELNVPDVLLETFTCRILIWVTYVLSGGRN